MSPIMTAEEVAEYFRMSREAFYMARSRRKPWLPPPMPKLGRRVLYRRVDVEACTIPEEQKK